MWFHLTTIDLSVDNKRDPECIRKFLVWYPYVLQLQDKYSIKELWDGHGQAFNDTDKYICRLNTFGATERNTERKNNKDRHTKRQHERQKERKKLIQTEIHN